jgi:hypothetical protein
MQEDLSQKERLHAVYGRVVDDHRGGEHPQEVNQKEDHRGEHPVNHKKTTDENTPLTTKKTTEETTPKMSTAKKTTDPQKVNHKEDHRG